jgi:Tol biopolymer transport system component
METRAANRTRAVIALVGAATLAGQALVAAASDAKTPPDQPVTRRVSKTPDRGDPNGPSVLAAVSGDCTAVAFESQATNLVDVADAPEPTGRYQVYVRDRGARAVSLASATPAGVPGNATSGWPTVSGDGTFVAFQSAASDLVAGDTNGASDVFLYNGASGRVTLVSRTPAGTPGDGNSFVPSISADGRYVAFGSNATDLDADDTNGTVDVYVYDRSDRSVRIASVATSGAQADGPSSDPSISADGRAVTFSSAATNLDPADDVPRTDVYWHSLTSGRTRLVSIGTGGVAGDALSNTPTISGNGRYVAFRSVASDLTSATAGFAQRGYVRDMKTGRTQVVSLAASGADVGDVEYYGVRISADGSRVAFTTGVAAVAADTNGETDVYLRNLRQDRTKLISVGTSRPAVAEEGSGPSISHDGRCVTFRSDSADLVAHDDNGTVDVFLRRLKQVVP